jgi:hypothetical protein
LLYGEWDTTSARGVAYDPDNDYLWIGGWNHEVIYCVKGLGYNNEAGETISTIPVSYPIAGLAWNCEGGTLWCTTCDIISGIYELNADNGDVLTALEFPDDYEYSAAGCEMDNEGNLWVVNQDTKKAYLVETDASGGCYDGSTGINSETITHLVSKSQLLYANYPNPFNPETTINFFIPECRGEMSSNLQLQIYDITGKLVKILINGKMEPGYHSVIWDGKDGNGKEVASGLYFYRIESDEFTETKQCLLLK